MKTMFSLAIVLSFLLLSCGEEITVSQFPFVRSFSPAGGKAGDTVIVNGFNFSVQGAGNTVKFNEATATVVDASFTKITVIVPADATTGKISVTVFGRTGTSADDFTVGAMPVPTVHITAFSPATGTAGDEVTITGSNFSTDIGQNTVKFANDVTATVTAATATELKVTVPAGAITGKIAVTVNGTTGTSANDFTVPAIPTLSINTFSPAMGVFDQIVTITGTGFSTDIGQNIVKFSNNKTATIYTATTTELKVAVPANAITGVISVTVGTQSATSSAVFEMLKDIPRNGLVGFYPFNGNGNDASGNGNDLTPYGTTAQPDRFGINNHAYSFIGGNSYVGNTSIGGTQIGSPITVALWVKYDSLIGSSFVSKYAPDNGFILGANGEGKITCTIDGAESIISNSVHLPVKTNGQWIFIGITYDGVSFLIYKNGVLAETITKPGSIRATFAPMRIGLDGYVDPASPHAFHCMIDDVTIYFKALGDIAMQQLYEQNISKQ